MYSTKEAIRMINKSKSKLCFVNTEDDNIHIFKSVNGDILVGRYGDGAVYKFNIEGNKNLKWVIDFNGSIK